MKKYLVSCLPAILLYCEIEAGCHFTNTTNTWHLKLWLWLHWKFIIFNSILKYFFRFRFICWNPKMPNIFVLAFMNLEYWRDQKYVKVFLSIFNILFDAEEGWRENIIFFFCDFSLWTPEGAKYSEFSRCWFLQAMKGRKLEI